MDTRENIINAAFKILSKEGAKALTTSKLIEEAGISKGGLYHHFKEIDEVYLALLQMLTESLTEGFYELEFDSIDHLNDVLVETLFDEMEATKDVYAALFYFMSSVTKNPEYKDYLKNWSEGSLKKWGELYSKFYDHEISEDEMDSVMRMIDMYIGGLIIHDFILDDIPKYKKITRQFLTLMTDILSQK
jgi:AcrR family transcriptional regulator